MKDKTTKYKVQANLNMTKRTKGLFQRYVKEGGWTMAGWIRKQINDAVEAQIEKEAARATITED